MKQLYRGPDGELRTENFNGTTVMPRHLGSIDVVVNGRSVLEMIPSENIPAEAQAFAISWTCYNPEKNAIEAHIEFYAEKMY